MSAIVLADIQDVCPDITRVAGAWLAWVNAKVNGANYDGEDGLSTKLVRIYLAAHFTVLGDMLGGASGGAVSSETEGGISRAYTSASLDASALNATAYGRSALQIIRMYVAGAWIADPDA